MGFMESNLELTPGPSAREFFHGGVTKVMVLPCSFCEVGGPGGRNFTKGSWVHWIMGEFFGNSDAIGLGHLAVDSL